MKIVSRHLEKRAERLEIRTTITYRDALARIALEKRRTLSSLLEEMIEKLIEENPPK